MYYGVTRIRIKTGVCVAPFRERTHEFCRVAFVAFLVCLAPAFPFAGDAGKASTDGTALDAVY